VGPKKQNSGPHFLSPLGRTRIEPYFWWTCLFHLFVFPAGFFYLLLTSLGNRDYEGPLLGIPGVPEILLIGGFCIWLLIALTTRRLRDAGFWPWLALAVLIPGIGQLLIIALWFSPTKELRSAWRGID
jgi:uncharacterized membrane protein YhaH (DUF805 family)